MESTGSRVSEPSQSIRSINHQIIERARRYLPTNSKDPNTIIESFRQAIAKTKGAVDALDVQAIALVIHHLHTTYDSPGGLLVHGIPAINARVYDILRSPNRLEWREKANTEHHRRAWTLASGCIELLAPPGLNTHDTPCGYCQSERGPFEFCKTAGSVARGACSNCAWRGEVSKCDHADDNKAKNDEENMIDSMMDPSSDMNPVQRVRRESTWSRDSPFMGASPTITGESSEAVQDLGAVLVAHSAPALELSPQITSDIHATHAPGKDLQVPELNKVKQTRDQRIKSALASLEELLAEYEDIIKAGKKRPDACREIDHLLIDLEYLWPAFADAKSALKGSENHCQDRGQD